MSGMKERKRRAKPSVGKKGNMDNSQDGDQLTISDDFKGGSVEKIQTNALKDKKRKKFKKVEKETVAIDQLSSVDQGGSSANELENEGREKTRSKSRRKKSKSNTKKEDEADQQNDQGGSSANELENERQEKTRSKSRRKKSKSNSKKEDEADQQNAKLIESDKNTTQIQPLKEESYVSEKNNCKGDDVYEISSGDEDCSKGIKKWIMEYHKRRPGLDVLQQRIDDFITAHEARVEQEKKERKAKAAEDGWTFVDHHKGRKKTTEAETGVTVGSVTLAAAQDQWSKKKKNQVAPDFYRFQRREARRNEIMILQSKFEQDKKRMQQLRAARKFRPY